MDRIKILCIEQGTTISKLERALGYSNGSINNKSKNGISLSNKRLVEVADYLGTTVDYILTGRKQEAHYANEETAKLAQELLENNERRVLLDASRDLSPEELKAIVAMVNAFSKK